jgi:acetyltransferase-like isoleucine patch superfamily enzyme
MSSSRFHPLIPGGTVPNDWWRGRIPANIVVGDNCVIDSSLCFKHFYSQATVGLRLGDNVTVWRSAFSVEEEGVVEIGDDCYLDNASLACRGRIVVGARVMLSAGVTIADSDFHPKDPAARFADSIAVSPAGDRRRRPAIDARPVYVADDVWIGYNATILKGVHVGAGACIAPGSVVVRDVPEHAFVCGNPAVVTSVVRE